MALMKDIAVKCGVSVATVSKALNNQADVGEAMKERIREVAKEMGYFPNSAARALKTNRTNNIGVLFVDGAHSGLTHDYFAHVLESFKVTAESRGYDMTFINHNFGDNQMSYYEHCRYRGVDGVVIACVEFDNPQILELINSEIPVVTIDHIFNNRTAVVSDNASGMKDLTEYVIRMGHKKIAYIHGEDSAVTRERMVSFYRTMEEYGLEVPDEYVRKGVYLNTKVSAEQTLELLELPAPPSCILYCDDLACIGGINAINKKGLKIAEDISVAGYDGSYLAGVLRPKLTTLKQDTAVIGGKAAEQLIELIERPKTTLVERVVVKGTLLEGSSVKNLN